MTMNSFLILVIFLCLYGNCLGQATIPGGFQFGLGTTAADCGALPMTGGDFSFDTLIIGPNKVTFTCPAGYGPQPNITSVTCLSNGQWSSAIPTCRLIDCGDFLDFENGEVVLSNGTVYLSQARISCHEGYSLEPSNSTSLLCLSNDSWGNAVPTCKRNECGQLTRPYNGEVVSNGTTYQSVAEYSCHTGYDLVTNPSVSIRCLSTGKWSYTKVACEIKECGQLTRPYNGEVVSNGTTYQSVAEYSCHTGYDLVTNPSVSIRCLSTGKWSYTKVACEIKECGQLTRPYNGEVVSNGTTYQSVAEYSCHTGYDLVTNPSVSIRCLSTGKWSYTKVACEIKDCGEPTGIENGNITWTSTTYGSEAYYHCNKHFMLANKSMARCGPDGNWVSSRPAACISAQAIIECKIDTDDRKTTWPETKRGEVTVRDCSIVKTSTELTGTIKRECGEDGIWKLPKYDCINQKLLEIAYQVEELRRDHSAANVQNVLATLANATTATGNTGLLYDGELEKVTTILETIAAVSNNISVSVNQSQKMLSECPTDWILMRRRVTRRLIWIQSVYIGNHKVASRVLKDFIDTASNLLDTTNQKSWEAVAEKDNEEKKNSGAAKVLEVVDTYASAIANTLLKSSNETKRTIQNVNMALQVAKIDQHKKEDIYFPDGEIKSIPTKSSISLKTDDLKGVKSYSAVIYRNLSGILPSTTKNSKIKVQRKVNSVVLSLGLHGGDAKLKTPVTINLEHFEKKMTNPLCSFWNTALNAWDSQGCTLVSTNSSISVCQCTHLTSFAILMSPWTDDSVTKALDVISIVGCSISLAALIITVATYRILWRDVKSDIHVILMNLSTALAISYVVFLAGIDQTENKGACTAIAVILQYIYLVVFFLMLVEGIELAVMVLYVFQTKSSRIKWMLPLAWGAPAIIVGISLAVTQLKGYGTDEFCWLSIDDGLIWGFVGPALCIIVVNVVLLALVMKKMCQRVLSTKSNVEKAKSGVRNLCVLLPLMGVTWVLGMFYVNKDFVWMQYAFAVCNSLQGLVIFVFHCALKPQIRSAIQRRRKKYLNSYSLPSSSNKHLSKPKVSKSSSSIDVDDFSYSRSYSQDSFSI